MGRVSDIYTEQGGHVPSPSRRASVSDTYPFAPAPGRTETSAAAAKAVAPVFTKRQQTVMDQLAARDMTNSEIFRAVANLSAEDYAAYCRLRKIERGLQPRTGDLRAMGKVFDSGKTRKNPTGNSEVVWTLRDPNAPPEDPQMPLL